MRCCRSDRALRRWCSGTTSGGRVKVDRGIHATHVVATDFPFFIFFSDFFVTRFDLYWLLFLCFSFSFAQTKMPPRMSPVSQPAAFALPQWSVWSSTRGTHLQGAHGRRQLYARKLGLIYNMLLSFRSLWRQTRGRRQGRRLESVFVRWRCPLVGNQWLTKTCVQFAGPSRRQQVKFLTMNFAFLDSNPLMRVQT